MKPSLLLLYTALSGAADVLVCTDESCYATEPTLPRPTAVTGADGISSSLIPFVWTDLVQLTSTTTVETTITQTDSGALLITPTVSVIVQPKGYWWRNQLLGPPVTPPGPQPRVTTGAPVPPPAGSSGAPTPVISTSSSIDSDGVVVPVPITLTPPNINPPDSNPKPDPKPDPKPNPDPTPILDPDPSKSPQNTPTEGGGQPSNTGGGGKNPTQAPSPTPAPDDCDDPKTADRCTASCIASTATPDTTLTTTCTTTVCRKNIGCNAAPTTVSEIRTKKDSPACTLTPQLSPDGLRQLANAQEIMDGADDLEDLLAKLDPDLVESGDAPATSSETPAPTTLQTSVVSSAPPESSSAPESSSTPEPPPPPSPSPSSPPPVTNKWTIHVHQVVDPKNDKNSHVEWTLTDSNGNDRKKGQDSPLTADDIPNQINMKVDNPTNIEKTKITWDYMGSNGRCIAVWSTGGPPKKPLGELCKGGDFKCDDMSDDNKSVTSSWRKRDDGVFERFFDCRITSGL